MGLFRPKDQAQELDPQWQRRRRVFGGVIGLTALVAAGLTVWYFTVVHQPPAPPGQSPAPEVPAPTQTATAPGTPALDPDPGPDLSQVLPGLPQGQRFRIQIAEGARLSLEQGHPWVFQWAREWDQIGGLGSTLQEEFRLLQVFLLTRNRPLTEHWYRHLQSRMVDSESTRNLVAEQYGDEWQVLQLIMLRRLERALEELSRMETERPPSPNLRLLKMIVLRDMSEDTGSNQWAEELIELAAGTDRVAALARAELVRLIETGQAAGFPAEALAAIADPRSIEEPGEDEESVGPGETADATRRLTTWLRQLFEQQTTLGRAANWPVLALSWALADEETAPDLITELLALATELEPVERLFAAEWLWRRDAWEQVVELLQPGTEVPLTPLTLDLYTSAMTRLGSEEELAAELTAQNSRWPDGLVQLWQIRQKATEGAPEMSGMLQGLFMKAGRSIRDMEPGWLFEVARTAFVTDFPATGQDLLMLASESPLTRERALVMLFDRSLESGKTADARYILNQLQQLTKEPGPWHGPWLWFQLMQPGLDRNKASQILAETRDWLETSGQPPLNPSEAKLIGSMASIRAGEMESARTWFPSIEPNELPSRYLPFFFKIRTFLGRDSMLLRPLEKRWGDRPVLLTREEAVWLQQSARELR